MIRHALAPVNPSAAQSLELPRRLPGLPGVALTFDDGPHPEGTPAVLELLAQAGAHATFFMVGEQVRQRPALAAAVVAAGHRVALHGSRHRLQLRLPAATVRADIERGRVEVEDAAGVGVTLHRPAFGIYSSAGLSAARAAGLQPLLWSRWGKDWRRLTRPGRIAARVLHGIGPGDVVLLHDADFYSSRHSHNRTVAALGLILAGLAQRRLAAVLPDGQALSAEHGSLL